MHRASRQSSVDAPVELENEVVLRLPTAPAQCLQQALREGASSLKDRLFISVDHDTRRCTVRFDNWYLPAKIVDLPTITEAYKTIDKKNFYKTADICQMMICREDDDTSDDEGGKRPDEAAKKKRDTGRVDKKYLHPHGFAPPLKNVRKRRFRRATRKKLVEAPEIEKEVKRLLRMDNEAVTMRWDLDDANNINNNNNNANNSGETTGTSVTMTNSTVIKEELDVHDIFGDELSDSGEEDLDDSAGTQHLHNTEDRDITLHCLDVDLDHQTEEDLGLDRAISPGGSHITTLTTRTQEQDYSSNIDSFNTTATSSFATHQYDAVQYDASVTVKREPLDASDLDVSDNDEDDEVEDGQGECLERCAEEVDDLIKQER